MLKKTISLILSCLLVFSLTSAFAASFSDVTSAYSWAEEAIQTLADGGVINGYPDGTFKPGNNITKEEAIALFARILGASEEINKPVVSLSNLTYEDALSGYTSFAKEAAAYLLYKNVLTEKDLSTYLSSANKGDTLKRYEAATLIAKCLGGEIWLKNNPDITLSYSDASNIPASAKGYVYFASEAQIMQGMGDNEFGPMGNVTRAQVAVMLHRMYTKLNYSYTSGIISQINSGTQIISIRDASGEIENYKIGNNVAIMLDGKQSQLANLPVGQNLVITFSNGGLYSLDVVQMVVDDEFEAVYKGQTTDSTGTTVRLQYLNSSETVTYKLAADAVIVYDNKSGSINSLNTNDHVKVSVQNGKITMLDGQSRSGEIAGGTVEAISFDPDVTISIRHKDGTLGDYSIKSGASIRRNGTLTTFSELVVGDRVDVTLDYGMISAVVATGVEKVVTGSIEEIKISKTGSTLKVNINGTINEYAIARDAKITLDGATATIYDLRLGYNVRLTTSSATISEVKVESVASPMQITGQITLVNTSYGMIRVSSTDSYGTVTETQVFIKSGAKILDSNDGKMKDIKNLTVGMNVTAAGAENVGIFEATSVMILTATK